MYLHRLQNTCVEKITTSDDGGVYFNIVHTGGKGIYSVSHNDVGELTRWQHSLSQLNVDLSKS